MTGDAVPMMFQVSCDRCGGKPRKWLAAPGHSREEVLEDLHSLVCTGCGSPYSIEVVANKPALPDTSEAAFHGGGLRRL